MTLVEIKTKVPELQTKIADLVKANESDSKALATIDREIEDATRILKDAEDDKKTFEERIARAADSSKMQGYKKANETKKKEAEDRIKTQKKIIAEQKKKRDAITKPDTEYSKRAAELTKVKAELDAISDLLVQDPTINYHMQTAVMVKFDEQIQAENDKKENFAKISKELGKLLQDDSKDGLKTIAEELKEGKEEYSAAFTDSSIDPNAARKKATDAQNKLKSEIKAKLGIDISNQDIDYILSAMDSNQLDNLSIPSFEKEKAKIDAVITKMQESREKTLAAIEAKKVVGDAVVTPEMEENKKDIERLTGEVDALETELAAIDTELTDLDKQIKDKEDELGDPSEDYIELKDAEKNLKENHIITTDAMPDLLDEKSDLSKKYKEFVDADLAVRQAFQNCKTPVDDGFIDNMSAEDRRNEAVDKLKQAISNYQKVAEELGSLSGYDAEAWQNYLAEDINSRVMDKQVVDEAYYHTNDNNFKEMLNDKDAMNGGKAIDEYEAVEGSLAKINDAQDKILKGKFDLAVEDLFKDPDKGYYKLMDDFQKSSGLDKATHGEVSVYDLMKHSYLIEPKPLNRIKGFFKRIASKFKAPKLPFDIPEDKQDAIERYKDAKTEDVKEEIESRKGLEELKARKEALIDKRNTKTSEKVGKEVELTQAEEKRVELEKNAPARASQIEATDIDIRKTTYKDSFIQEAVDKVERDLDEGR